jgi:hypothetical protein
MTKMSITRALTTVKMLEKKFNKNCDELHIVSVESDGKLESPDNYMKKEDFSEKAKAQLSSVNDTLDRIKMIKKEIDKANSSMTITIAGKTMTIQEALVEKKYLPLKEKLLTRLKYEKNRGSSILENANDELQERADALRSSDSKSVDKTKEVAIVDSFLKKFNPTMVDPCNIGETVEKLEKWIEEFKNNIDFALSEINSKTEIDIPD